MPMKSPFYTEEHEAFREVVRRFVEKEIEPYAHEWDEAGEFPRVLYEKAAAIGLLGLGFPERSGGIFRWAEDYGLAPFVQLCDGLAHERGSRFEPSPWLRALAARDEGLPRGRNKTTQGSNT